MTSNTFSVRRIPFKPPAKFFDGISGMPFSFFLDGGMSFQRLGRYSFVGSEPFLVFRSRGDRVEVVGEGGLEAVEGNPFDVLEKLLSEHKKPPRRDSPVPFVGGAVGYFGYDLYPHLIGNIRSQAADDVGVWDCVLGFYDRIFAFDNLQKKAFAVSYGRGGGTDIAFDAGFGGELNATKKAGESRLKSNFTKKEYVGAVEKAKDYIRAGDIYQVNLSQRFSAKLSTKPWTLYKRLREINPAPFAAYLSFGDVAVVSASPERFLKVSGRHIETRPIKGTRPRGRTPEEDQRLARELMGSAKDKAEHVMIVDLERNDLGRICEYGSVKVSEFEILESYPTVHHMVSTVEGRLRPEVGQVDCLRACFPGGSITGAPKVRSMEIIEELEPTKRSVYTGSIGYLGFDGTMDLNIVIRTFVASGRRIFFQVGGGVVADSDPLLEYEETLDKGRALVEAVGGGRKS